MFYRSLSCNFKNSRCVWNSIKVNHHQVSHLCPMFGVINDFQKMKCPMWAIPNSLFARKIGVRTEHVCSRFGGPWPTWKICAKTVFGPDPSWTKQIFQSHTGPGPPKVSDQLGSIGLWIPDVGYKQSCHSENSAHLH